MGPEAKAPRGVPAGGDGNGRGPCTTQFADGLSPASVSPPPVAFACKGFSRDIFFSLSEKEIMKTSIMSEADGPINHTTQEESSGTAYDCSVRGRAFFKKKSFTLGGEGEGQVELNKWAT